MKTKNKPSPTHLNRRQFFKTAGGLSFVVITYSLLPGCSSALAEGKESPTTRVSAWVHVQTNGDILILNPAAEMGQGSMTALAAIIAEEMDADWSRVKIEHAPIDAETYGLQWNGQLGGPMLTVGSRTVMGYFKALRLAGAQVRQVFLESASQLMNHPASELYTQKSEVIHRLSGNRLTYGEIANQVSFLDKLPEIKEDQLKKTQDFTLIGQEMRRYDIPEKVNGKARYGIDIHLPEMIYGVINRSPAYGALPTLLNEEEMQSLPGVLELVHLDHGIGILAETIEEALAAKKKLRINWGNTEANAHNSEKDLFSYASVSQLKETKISNLTDKGNPVSILNKAESTHSADFFNDYVYHCQMEPLNAVVSISTDRKSAEIWAGSQYPDGAKAAAAQVLDMDKDKIEFHPCFLGGGFGRRSMSGYITEACHLAKNVDKPVKLIWTREDDVAYGAFRPQSLQRLQASTDKSGKINAWVHTVVGPGDNLLGSGARTQFYTIPNQKVEVRSVNHHIRTKHWRSVGHGPNKYAIEAFIDLIAKDLGKNPYSFRMDLMSDYPRAQEVLKVVADMADWGGPVPEGRARGIAFAERSRSLGAGICELSVDRTTGLIRIHKFWAALDAGIVVHPDNVIAQMEGGIIMGISSVLKERISFLNGIVEQSNYHNYPILRMSECPDSIEIKIIESTKPPTGVGESSTPLVGGAIANAFLALTGRSLNHMPFTPAKVLEVLET